MYTARQIAKATGCSSANVSSALAALLNYKAVDIITGTTPPYWFATPKTDTRVRVVKERVLETKPRKRKAKRI